LGNELLTIDRASNAAGEGVEGLVNSPLITVWLSCGRCIE